MKISASKKQLANIISENGGWCKGAEFAWFQGKLKGKSCHEVWFGSEHSCPSYEPITGSFHSNFSKVVGKLPTAKFDNWHQAIITSDEYFHLYPAPDADGWIEYCGTERPLGVFAEIIDVRLYDGRVLTDFAGRFEWNTDGNARIVAYRLSKQEQAKSNAVGDDETNLAAKEELEALEFSESPEQRAKLAKIYAPSIEQLAADYHSKLAIAKQAQEEADSHRCGAEAALEKLYQAGLKIGLDIAIASKEDEDAGEPELVITDWRQWQVGDCISWSIISTPVEYKIISVHHDEHREIGDFEIMDGNGNVFRCYGDECKFIRRP